MIFTDNMKNMKIYKQPCFLPTVEGNKKKDSAVIMLTPDYESSKRLMNNPIFINKKRYESYYLDRDVSYYIGNKQLKEIDEDFLYLEETKRSNLKDSDFGIPEDRKFPLDTEEHVRSAIKLFGHAEESKKKSLARKISRRASKYGIKIPETTQCYKYLHEDFDDVCTNKDIMIFDIGNVLVKDLTLQDLYHMFESIDPSYIEQIYYISHDMFKNGLYETSTIEEELHYISTRISDDARSVLEEVYKAIVTGCRPYDYTITMLNTLKSKGYNLYYLSNWNKSSFEINIENGNFDFLKLFNGGVVSYQVGVRKPSREIYDILMKQYNLDPNKCLFFDDRPENVEAAKSLGIDSYVFDVENTSSTIVNDYKPVYEAFQLAEADDNLEFKFSVPNTDIIDIKFEMDEKEKRWNSIVIVEGIAPKTLRGRSECIVIKDDMIYLDETGSGICSKGGIAKIMYDVPGGGWDPNEPHDICAIRETNEEAMIDVKDVQYVDNYATIDKVRPEGCYCDGLFSKVYVGKYNGRYTGPIAQVDRADIAVSGKFYPIAEVYADLNPIHRKAIDQYFGREYIDNAELESPVDEAVILLEFDISATIKDIKLKIRRFLYNLINKIEHWVRKIKNPKVQKVLLTITEKAKDLLNKNNELEDRSRLQDLMKKANELGEEFNETILVEKYIDQEDGEVKRADIACDIAYQVLNKHDIDVLWNDPRVQAERIGTFDTYKARHKDRDLYDKSKWDKKYLNLILNASVAETFNKEYCYYIYDVATYVYGIQHNTYESYIEENKVFSTKNLEYNIDKWNSGSSNILFITGLSGSGKSTLAANIADKKNAINVEIDLLEHNDIIFDPNTNNDEGNLVIKAYMEKYHGGAHKFKISNNAKAWASEVERFLKYCISTANTNKDKKYVVEGIQLMDIPNSVDVIKSYPTIVVGTSMIKSMWQAYKREECSFIEYMKSFKSIAGLKEYLDWYMSMEKDRNNLVKNLKEGTEFILET